MFTTPNLCVGCVHLERNEKYELSPPSCVAFPDGIPGAVWQGVVAHFDPLADEPVQFELIPGFESALDAYIGYWFTEVDDGEPEQADQ